jgi:O-acetyl-ADP-ribose deacetylase (regulator of RNase III)
MDTIRVFISYRRKLDASRYVAEQIYKHLNASSRYNVFMDKQSIPTAAEWARVIYGHIHMSDVLIVLLEPDTAESEWVQREVDVARGAHVSILPLNISGLDMNGISKPVEQFALEQQQINPFQMTPEHLKVLGDDLERLAKVTRNNQQGWIDRLTSEKWRAKAADNNPNYRIFTLPERANTKIHLATGDMTQMGVFIDTMVNSENNYMQMARVYETYTISSTLRFQGSKFNKARDILEDTVQQELEAQIYAEEGGYGRPVGMKCVIPTHAGHPTSTLRRKARYIFHVATVRVDPNENPTRVSPLRDDKGLEECITNCFDMVNEVNAKGGAIFGGDPLPDYKPIQSIIFPLFGTGQGGRSTHEVVQPMARAIRRFVQRHDNLSLDKIYLCVYQESEIPIVEQELIKVFGNPL